MPPVAGIIAPSSAMTIVPSRQKRPPPIQTARCQSEPSRSRAMAAGVMKIPDPSMVPTLIIVASVRLRVRRSSGLLMCSSWRAAVYATPGHPKTPCYNPPPMRQLRRPYGRVAALCTVASVGASLAAAAAGLPTPQSILGRGVGEDRFLAPYPKVLEYFRALDSASDRVSLEVAGKSTLGNDMVIVILTSAANQRSLERYRGIARRLAHPEDLPEHEARGLIESGKTIVLVTCSIHSTEVASTQMAMELAHDLAATEDPETLAWLDDVILLLMPSINPDGQVMVIDWYNKYLGTPFEGGAMPWLYHHYVGHDNNRDSYMLTQKETQVV